MGDDSTPNKAERLFQITENDLGDLERSLPRLAESLLPVLTNRDRVLIRRCQAILSNVRWGYGPPTCAEQVGDQNG